MTAIKVNTPASPTEFPNSPGYCNKFIAWCRKNPKKTVVAFIIVIAIVIIWIHGPFHRASNLMSGPSPFGQHNQWPGVK